MAKINVSKGWDFSLDYSDKKKLARDLGIASWLIWFGYSTPTTMNFAWKLFTGVMLFGIPHLAQVLGLFAALIIQWYEMKLVKLAAWKSWWIMLAVVPCMLISIAANIQLETVGLKTQKLKYDDLTDLNAMIATQVRSIADDSVQIAGLNEIVNQKLLEGKTPSTRTLNRIENFTVSKNQKTQELQELVRQKNEKAAAYGPLVTLGDLKTGRNSYGGLFLAIFLESLMVGSMLASIGIYKTEELYIQEEKAKHDTLPDEQALAIERENYLKIKEELNRHIALSAASSLPQPITLPANGNGKSVQIYGENFPSESENFTPKMRENFTAKRENLQQILHPESENFTPKASENFTSETDELGKILRGDGRVAKENLLENLLRSANAKRMNRAEKIRLLVREFFANFPDWSNADIAREIPAEFKVTRQRVGQILKELGLLRRDRE